MVFVVCFPTEVSESVVLITVENYRSSVLDPGATRKFPILFSCRETSLRLLTPCVFS